MLQFLFVFVLVSEEFLGGNFGAEIVAARTWRASIAHDAKYRDLSGTSLASRVCNGDGSLIQSNEQANLLADINSFLGLPSQEFAVSGLAPGMILSGLCMFLWCMYLCREFRTIWISIEAILQIPRARKTVFSNGRFVAISYFRLGVYLMLRLYRASITACLLWAGQQWLAKTKSITDLILNASALGTILEIDELVFASLLPKKIQAAVYSLEAVKVRYTKAKSQLEGSLIFLGVVAVTLTPIFVWVIPLVDMMQRVKVEFCFGAQNFVVAYNQDSQTTVGLATPSFAVRSENGLSLSERAVLGHTVPTAESTFVGPYDWDLIYFSDDPDSFAQDTVISQASVSAQTTACLDADNWLRRYGPVFTERHMPRFHAAAAMIGRDNATSCAELADKCDDFDSRVLRSVCPRTCDCHLPQANQWFKVPAQGCPDVCREEAATRSQDIQCRDSPVGEDWLSFWDSYPDVMQEHLGVNFSDPNNPVTGAEFVHGIVGFMKTAGCPGLMSVQEEPITRTPWCQGNQLSASLAYICPVSCGCLVEDVPDYCPRSCKACGDVANFPANSNMASCVEAKQLGICGIPEDAAKYCADTCGICNGTSSASTVCPDGPLPAVFGLGSCADVQVFLASLKPIFWGQKFPQLIWAVALVMNACVFQLLYMIPAAAYDAWQPPPESSAALTSFPV
ncbi:hypothetical protein AK812_SmicGene41189 [Symbiodinium microadriaticum]|uniref:ShKT domain-containing protein n=1 Tax=Symbiodinium microadriaticum TaxID=2951 RepID=A0A1Q9C6R9_SYMMI|nr:hypothetical protein AK812_SmicGene41189 [Symbiodinium microadriaticum]